MLNPQPNIQPKAQLQEKELINGKVITPLISSELT
jgi:hypothetical protein